MFVFLFYYRKDILMMNINKNRKNKGTVFMRVSALALVMVLCFTCVSCGTIDKVIDSLEGALDVSGEVTRPGREPAIKDDESKEVVIPDTKTEYFTYETKNGEITITGYTGTDTVVKIPATIEDKAVTAIGKNAVSDRRVADGQNIIVKQIIVPDSVEEIEHGAFAGCKSVEKYSAPFVGGTLNEHTYVGYVFGATSPETNGSTVPPSLETASFGGVTVEDDAFLGCENIRSITFRDILTVGDKAFFGCSMLKTVIFPDSVQIIGEDIFDKCTSLTELRLPFIGDREENHFLGYIFGAKSYKENVDYIPSSLKKLTVVCYGDIPAYAFYECLYLTNVTIIGKPQSVGEYAFYLCKKMRTLNVGDESFEGPSVINSHSFAYCNALTSVKLAATVSDIPAHSFYGCSSLRTIKFGEDDNIVPPHATVGEYAFAYCAAIMEIELPTIMTSIPKGLFYGCTSLRQISLPFGVTSIEAEAFKGCSSLANVVFPDSNMLESIGESAFSYCGSLRGIDVDPDEDKASYVFTIPNSVKSIGEYAFAYCDYIKVINLPENLNAIPDYCFFGCSSLKTIAFGVGDNVLSESVWKIGEGAFSGCASMENITLPKTVTMLGKDAFDSCDELVFRVVYESDAYNWLLGNGIGSSRMEVSNG